MNRTSPYKFLPVELAERLRRVTLTVSRPVGGSGQGLHRSPHFGASVEFAEYREYSPGDPPARIDWAVFARSDRYMVRRFQEETNLRAYVLLDASESMAYREHGAVTKMEYAARVAAGLLFVIVNQGDSVGLVAFDSAVRMRHEPAGSMEGLRRLLLSLEDVVPCGRGDIEAVLHGVAGTIRARSLVILISDLLQDPAAILRGLRHLAHDRHAILVVHVLDPAELALPDGGLTEFRELETRRRMAVELDDIRRAYAGEVQSYIDELRRGCADSQAVYRFADTRMPVENLLAAKVAHA